MRSSRFHSVAFRLAAAVALTLGARAADITWVGNASVNWADPNWSGINNPPIANDALIFGVAGTAGAILNNNLAASIQFDGITFNDGASAFTFNGNGITLGGSLANNSSNLQTINLPIAMTEQRTFATSATGGDLTLGGVLSGAGGYVATGVGTIELNGPDSNINTGETTVSDGTLELAKTGGRAVTGPLNIIDGTVVVGGTGGNQIDDVVVVSFTGSNSAAGILRLANNAETIGGLSSFGFGIVENESDAAGTGTLTVNTTAPQSFGGTLRDGDGVGIDGALSLIKTGASTLTLGGVNTHTGPTLVSGGTLNLTGSLNASSLLTIANATVDGFGAIDGNVNVLNGGTLANDGVIGGNISLATGGTLSGTSLIAGLVTAASGSRISPAGGTLPGTIFTAALTLGNGSLLDYELGASSDLVAVTVAGGLTINGGAFNVFDPGGASPLLTNGTYTLLDYDIGFTGAITDLSVANSQIGKFYTIGNDTTNTRITLTVIDTTISEWTDGAADTLWTSAGNWSLGVPNAPGAVARFGTIPTVPTGVNVTGGKTVGGILFDNLNSYTIIGGATDLPITLDNGFAAATITVINGHHTIEAPIDLATSANATTATGTSLTLAGEITGAKTFIAAGLGTTILTGSNSFAAINIIGGTLRVNANNGLGAAAGPVLIENDATLQAGGTLTIATRTATLGRGGGTIDTNGNTVTLAADSTITGTELTKVGAGKLAILGVQTYDTLTTEAGRTDLGSALGTGTSTINANAETNLGVSQTLSALNIGAGGVVTLGPLPPAPLDEAEEIAGGNDPSPLNEETASNLAGIDVQAVPEPGSLSLLCLGVLGVLRRKRCAG